MVSLFLKAIQHNDSHGTQHLALSLVGMYSAAAAASMPTMTKFSYSSFSVCLSNIS